MAEQLTLEIAPTVYKDQFEWQTVYENRVRVSPWGSVQNESILHFAGHEFYNVDCAGHGGLRLTDKQKAFIARNYPSVFDAAEPNSKIWFEEDCASCVAMVAILYRDRACLTGKALEMFRHCCESTQKWFPVAWNEILKKG